MSIIFGGGGGGVWGSYAVQKGVALVLPDE